MLALDTTTHTRQISTANSALTTRYLGQLEDQRHMFDGILFLTFPVAIPRRPPALDLLLPT